MPICPFCGKEIGVGYDRHFFECTNYLKVAGEKYYCRSCGHIQENFGICERCGSVHGKPWRVWKYLGLDSSLPDLSILNPGPLNPTLKASDAFRAALGNTNRKISAFGDPVVDQLTNLTNDIIPIVLVSPEDLGLDEHTSPANAIIRGERLGLKMCTIEAGLRLGLQFHEQRPNTCVLVATQPILVRGVGDDEQPRLIQYDHDNQGLWLKVTFYPIYGRLNGDALYAFTL